MPDNDLVFDYHEHHDDHIHRGTGYAHIHDRHPYHEHDRNSSVVYHPAPGVIDIHNADDNHDAIHLLDRITHNHVIGVGGNDLDRRTTPTAPTV